MKEGCFLQKSQNLQRFIGAGATPGNLTAHLSRAAVLFSRLRQEAPTGADPTLFPPFVVRWVAIVVEDLQHLARLQLLFRAFDVLLHVL
jgi:hypothetical protein